MKKILIVLSLCLVSFCSAETFAGGEEITERFFNNGEYIKVIRNKNNTYYYAKATVSGIRIDENDMRISTIGYNIWTDENGDSISYEIDDWKISNDENDNIVIERR